MFPIDNGITPSGFLQCDMEDFDDIGLTKIGKKLFLRNFMEVKGIVNQSQIKTLELCSIAVIHVQCNTMS